MAQSGGKHLRRYVRSWWKLTLQAKKHHAHCDGGYRADVVERIVSPAPYSSGAWRRQLSWSTTVDDDVEPVRLPSCLQTDCGKGRNGLRARIAIQVQRQTQAR